MKEIRVSLIDNRIEQGDGGSQLENLCGSLRYQSSAAVVQFEHTTPLAVFAYTTADSKRMILSYRLRSLLQNRSALERNIWLARSG